MDNFGPDIMRRFDGSHEGSAIIGCKASTMTKSCVALGSQSAIKIAATKAAFQSYPLQCYDVPSGVKSQPVGKDETYRGALNRARAALKHATTDKHDVAWGVGIENGMWHPSADTDSNPDDGGWVDGACIVAVRAGTEAETKMVWSDTIEIPEVSERPFPKGPAGEWSVLKDPHLKLTGTSRTVILSKALTELAHKCEEISGECKLIFHY